MADETQGQGQVQQPRVPIQKVVSLKEDAYYSNCTMIETTPFDISILFGKVRPKTDERNQGSLVEVYEKQVYLSHIQARALYQALGRSLGQVFGQPEKESGESVKPTPTQ